MRINRYDRVAAALVALLILVGGSVGVLGLVWWTTHLEFASRFPVEPYRGGAGDPPGAVLNPEPPGIEELPELQPPDVQAALAAVSEAVTTVMASLDAYDTSTVLAAGRGPRRRDDRPLGPPGPADRLTGAIPRWERWEIRYNASNLDEYARRLDFFGIELGAAGGAPQVDYGSDFSQDRPQARQGASRDERRLYFSWQSGGLREFDRRLLGRAGVSTAGRIVLQFLSSETEERLAKLEMSHATAHGRASVNEIERTVFGVRPDSAGYEFFVLEQR